MLIISDEGVYVDSTGKVTKNVVLQWGELPTSVGMLISIILWVLFPKTLDKNYWVEMLCTSVLVPILDQVHQSCGP